MKHLLFLFFFVTLAGTSALAAPPERQFGHFSGDVGSLRPDILPAGSKERRSHVHNSPKYGDQVEWTIYKQKEKSTDQAYSIVEITLFRPEVSGTPKYYGAKDQNELNALDAERKAMHRAHDDFMTYQSLLNQSGKTTTLTHNSFEGVDTRLFRSDQSALDVYIKARKAGKFGNYHSLGWVERTHTHGFVYTREVAQAGNLFIRTRSTVQNGYDAGLPSAKAYMQAILAKLGGGSLNLSPEKPDEPAKPETPVPVAEKEVPRGEVKVLPRLGRTAAEGVETGLIPASPGLPARIQIEGAHPNAAAEWTLHDTEGAYLKSGKAQGASLKTKTDGKGNTEAQFFYAGGRLTAPRDFDITVMIAERKHRARVSVGLGLAFDKVRAIKGQDYGDRMHAFTLSVKSLWRPKLNLPLYLRQAEESNTWGSSRLGIRIETAWLNPDGSNDQAFRGTTEIKLLPQGNALVATEIGEPAYSAGYHRYPAVRMGGDGKHVYKVSGTPVVIDYTGKVLSSAVLEDLGNNGGMVVVSRDSPEGMLQSLSCAFEARDWVQYLMLETAKTLPGGKAVDWFTAMTSLVCGLAKENYADSFLEMTNFLGGKYLDHLDGIKDKLTPKQQEALKVAKQAYERIDENKAAAERDRRIREAGASFGIGGSEDSIDPSEPPPTVPKGAPAEPAKGEVPAQKPALPETDPGKALEAAGKELEGAVKDLKKSFQDLRNIFK